MELGRWEGKMLYLMIDGVDYWMFPEHGEVDHLVISSVML
jgi:hypothetical protein